MYKKPAVFQSPGPFSVNLDQKLFDLLQVGDFNAYICDGIFQNAEKITTPNGISQSGLQSGKNLSCDRKIYFDDSADFNKFHLQLGKFYPEFSGKQQRNLKARFSFRMLGSENKILHIQRQVVPVHVVRSPLRFLVIDTDIGYLASKPTGILEICNLDGKKIYVFNNLTSNFEKITVPLSVTEIKILKCIAQGHSSARIARDLFRSQKTIQTHRANMIRNTGLTSTTELIGHALKNNWI